MSKKHILSHIKGFTLIEIMTAVGILGILIVTICGVFVHGLYAIKKGKYRSAAIHVANQKFTELSEVDLGDPGGIPTEKISVPISEGGCINGFIDCEKNGNENYIKWVGTAEPYVINGRQKMADIDYNFKITIEAYKNNIEDLKKVTVLVTWTDVHGNQRIRLCTLLTRRI
ncbi:MAG TPA: prepilin-type N-terminal cleavage/methylation domain-containing protein [Candidatus Eremiobacteraeota bacterium]|nr:MAG: hypothetical protein BWY64_03432 [bacterium ADurb.Bin363]HPZ08751.1 prepilin-type N-terminal cleavage/methylation domain-containing protein [Candidatus Eremiobacteraeota bacterium]